MDTSQKHNGMNCPASARLLEGSSISLVLLMRLDMRVAFRRAPANEEEAEKATEVPLIDNLFAQEIYASGISGCSIMNGVVVLTLENARTDHSRTPAVWERVVVGRVALTIPAAQALVTGLNEFLEGVGASPSRAVVGGATYQ